MSDSLIVIELGFVGGALCSLIFIAFVFVILRLADGKYKGSGWVGHNGDDK